VEDSLISVSEKEIKAPKKNVPGDGCSNNQGGGWTATNRRRLGGVKGGGHWRRAALWEKNKEEEGIFGTGGADVSE